MKQTHLVLILVSFLMFSCVSQHIGKYKKESLPDNFKYEIIEDRSNASLEKNQVSVRINQKINKNQIATLAEELFESKDKQRRFYIFYLLEDMNIGSDAYATSHFDPELEIVIISEL